MAGSSVHVYFNRENKERIERMEYGQLSSICNKAVEVWAGNFKTLEEVRKEREAIKDNMDAESKRLVYIEKIESELLNEEKIKKEKEINEQEKEAQAEIEQHNKQTVKLKDRIIEEFKLSEEEALNLATEYNNTHPDQRKEGYTKWMESKGYKKQKC